MYSGWAGLISVLAVSWKTPIFAGMALQLLATILGLLPAILPTKTEYRGTHPYGVIRDIQHKTDRSTVACVVGAIILAVTGLALQVFGLLTSP